jgi:hypothetical protein
MDVAELLLARGADVDARDRCAGCGRIAVSKREALDIG